MSTSSWQRWKNIMKCYPFEEKRLSKWEPPYIVQPKYDGDRCRAIRLDSGEFILLSSEENLIYGVPHLNRILSDRIKSPGIELDGELYVHGLPHEKIHGIISRTANISDEHQLIQYHIFDIVNSNPQVIRAREIQEFENLSPWIKVAPCRVCYNLDEITRYYDELIELGYEGIIVRHITAPYERKRSLWVMKFKPKQEDSYEICGSVEEYSIDGSPKDTLGALVCRSGDGNLFNVGTGFSDELRHQLWEVRGLLPGNRVRIKYQHLTSGKNVPRFPVFVEVEWNV